MLMDKYES
jgi:hypothetical protein